MGVPGVPEWFVIGFAVVFFLICILIFVALSRWIFRINHIVSRLDDITNRLDNILNALDAGFNLEPEKKK